MNIGYKMALAGILATVMITAANAAKPKLPSGTLFGPTGIIGDAGKASIKVNGTQPGSPADGIINKGDEILGIGADKFSDPKREMAMAIDVAETDAAAGKMTLMLKGGKTVDITLPVLGSYSPTAPFNCPKSDKIITMTAEALLKQELESRLHPELLGLMATGEKKYIEAVAEAIRAAEWAKPDQAKIDACLAGEGDMGYVGWNWGYNLITLSEYYLLTKDESVLPAIKTYAVALAKGQDAGGLYGHRMISPKRFDRLPGYAQMNQPSLSCFMGMILAYRCGINDPDLKKAIATTYRYVDSHVGKGSFPYGVHGPNSRNFNNNGTSGSAALCMSFLNKPKAAQYFSQISAPTYDGLETGHASQFFNPFWTTLGANLSGPEVSSKFFKNSLWFHNLRRGFDGTWYPDWKEGPQEGMALLTYCMPRKALYITGKEADESIWLTGQDATDVIMLSKIDYKSLSPETLMDMAMNHPLPQVKRQAVGALGEHREQLTATWQQYLKDGTSKQKQLAISQYGWWIPIELRLPQLDAIGTILRNPDESMDVRVDTVGVLAYMGEPAQKYYPDIVQLMLAEKEDDPFDLIDADLGHSLNQLCGTPFASNLVPDKNAQYKAALKLIRHKRQNARASGLMMLTGMPLEDFHLVANDVIHVIEDKDPTYHSYHNPGGPVGAGVGVLADLGIKEGIDYALAIQEIPSGKGSFKMRAVMDSLAKYGPNAKPALEKLKADEKWATVPENRKLARNWQNMVKAIESDDAPKKLITLEEAIKAGK